MFRNLAADDIGGGINLIDIGASGRLDRKWRPVERLVNLYGFDPNEDECRRLSAAKHHMHSARYLPYAVGGANDAATLYKTNSIYCYSLLEPRESWLNRFSFGDLFSVEGTESIETHRFGDIPELAKLDVDVIKTDTQGLELPILSNADALLDRAFYIETETGFVENYCGETTYAQIDEFMRDHGFLLFDINVRHRISRNNQFQHRPSGGEQILWCEATWLRDYASSTAKDQVATLERGKALKSLLLCALQGCPDFGFELAETFHKYNLLSDSELGLLSQRSTWNLQRSLAKSCWTALGAMTRLLSRSTRRRLAAELERNVERPSLTRALWGKAA